MAAQRAVHLQVAPAREGRKEEDVPLESTSAVGNPAMLLSHYAKDGSPEGQPAEALLGVGRSSHANPASGLVVVNRS